MFISNQYYTGVASLKSNTRQFTQTLTYHDVAQLSTVYFPLFQMKVWCNFSDFLHFMGRLKIIIKVIKYGVK